jgi:glutamine amidotransferase
MSAKPNQAPQIAVIDWGRGNMVSAEGALEKVGAQTLRTAKPDELDQADGLVIAGNGTFAAAAEGLRSRGLDERIKELVEQGKPFFGICLGMQIIFEESEEAPGVAGLGLLKGKVEKLLPADGRRLPLMGWGESDFVNPAARLGENLDKSEAFYHMHSYVCRPDNEQVVCTRAAFDEDAFVTSIEDHPLYATQFHPERSAQAGLALISSFTQVCREYARQRD